MPQSLQGASFHVEHVTPRCRGGDATLANLAWACPGCNLHKSDRVQAPDPQTTHLVPLFNPRTDRWADHFRWEQFLVVPLTGTGRATAAALDFNQPRRVQIRRTEALFGLFPPDDSV
jgi:hypothetical protein